MVSVSSGIRRQVRENEGYGGIVVKLGLPLDEAMAVVDDVVAELAAGADDNDPIQFDVQETPRNPAITMDQCMDIGGVEQRLVAALEARGYHDAKLGAMPVVRPLHGHGLHSNPQDVIGAISAYTCVPGAPGETRGVHRTWRADRSAAERALTFGIDWALSLAGAEKMVDLRTGTFATRVSADGAARAMRARLRDQDPLRLQSNLLIAYSGHDFRAVNLPPAYGTMTLTQGNEYADRFDWAFAYDELTTVLRDAGSWCEYGHLARTLSPERHSPEHGSLASNERWSYGAESRLLIHDETKVFDAFGVMRLSQSFANSLALEPNWNLQRCAEPGYVLATSPTPAAWFAHTQVDKQLVQTSRDVLAGHLADHPDPENDIWERHLETWRRWESRGFNAETYWTR